MKVLRLKSSKVRYAWVACLVTPLCVAAATSAASVGDVQRQADGIVVKTDGASIRLQVWSDRIIRVTEAPGDDFPADNSLSVIAKPAAVKWDVHETPDAVT